MIRTYPPRYTGDLWLDSLQRGQFQQSKCLVAVNIPVRLLARLRSRKQQVQNEQRLYWIKV